MGLSDGVKGPDFEDKVGDPHGEQKRKGQLRPRWMIGPLKTANAQPYGENERKDTRAKRQPQDRSSLHEPCESNGSWAHQVLHPTPKENGGVDAKANAFNDGYGKDHI